MLKWLGILLLGAIAAACLPEAQVTRVPPLKSSDKTVSESAGKPSWQQTWDETLAAARKEGRVLVYSSANPQTRTAQAKSFKEKYGLEVEYVSGTSSEVGARFITEWRNGIRLADILILGVPNLMNFFEVDAVEPLGPRLLLPEVSDKKSWQWEKIPFVDKEQRVLSFLAGYSTVVAINTEMVRDGQIKSYFDLLKPEWKGKMLMYDPTIPGNANSWVAFMLLSVLGMDRGKEFMLGLLKQDTLIIRDQRLSVEWVARGRYPLSIGPNREQVTEFQLLGAPVKWIRLIEGGQVSPAGGNVSLPRQGSHPNAALIFLNWLLSQEGQTIFAKNYGTPSARNDVSTEGLDPAQVILPGEKVFTQDEEFYLARIKLAPTIREMFQTPVQK